MTEKGLYQVLFKSRKPIAKKFTDWVCEVIKEIRLTGKYELEKQLTLKNRELEIKDKQLEKISGKKVYGKTQEQFVYVYQPNPDKNKYKIGSKLEDLTQRQTDYLCGNPDGKFVYEKSCIKANMIEKSVHYALDKYRTINTREWFETDIDIIKKKINEIVNILDGDNALPYIPPKSNMLIKPPSIEQPKPKVKILKEINTTKNPLDFVKFI